MPETTEQQPTENTEQQQTQGEPADKPLGENGEKALRAERERANALEKQLREAQSKVEAAEQASLSELEKAQRRAEKAEKDLADAQSSALRQRVALEKGLPASLVGRLQGSTEEELSADADSLLELVKAPTTPRPDPSQGAKGAAPQGSTATQFASALEGAFNN